MVALIKSRFALLQALKDGGPGYGMALIGRVEKATNGRLKLNNGGIYQTLHRLETAGFVESELRGPGRRGGKPRRWYRITEKGRSEIELAMRVIAY